MKGNVIGFDPDSNIGAISGHDGQRYEFVRLEWRGPNAPSRGAVVDFMPAEGRAMQIYPVGDRGDRGDPAEGENTKLIYILYLVSLIVGLTSIVA